MPVAVERGEGTKHHRHCSIAQSADGVSRALLGAALEGSPFLEEKDDDKDGHGEKERVMSDEEPRLEEAEEADEWVDYAAEDGTVFVEDGIVLVEKGDFGGRVGFGGGEDVVGLHVVV